MKTIVNKEYIKFPLGANRRICIFLSGEEYAWIGERNKTALKLFGIIPKQRLKYLAKVLYEHFYPENIKEN